jgi:type 1 glutamine amidotransferase
MSRRTGSRAVATLALSAVLVLALGASAAYAETVLRVAVADSAIARGMKPADGSIRADMTIAALADEGITATKIGDGELLSLAALKNFDVVVLPRQLAMTTAQRLTMRQYVAEGGGLVAMFGTSRWDYTAGRSPAYIPIITLKWFGTTWDEFRAWEWGEISEIMQVKFNNDPLMYGGFHVGGADPSSHPILQATAAQLKRTTPLEMTQLPADFNEIVWTYPGDTNVQVLGTYKDAPTNDTPANGTPAMWTSLFYKGRLFYTGFQLYGLTRLDDDISKDASEYYGTAASRDTKVQARALLANAVRWAGTPGTTSDMTKSPLTGSPYSLSPGPRTSISIRSSAKSVRSLKPFQLTGVLTTGQVGDPCIVEVRKPGAARWSYSSARLAHSAAAGGANWWYRYAPKLRGTYVFRARFAGDTARPAGLSPNTVSVRVR